MNVFDPLITYSSPLRTAVDFIRATSEPASASERPNEQRIGASRSGGSQAAFCSSVPAMITGPAPRPFAPSDVPMPEQPQLSSSPTSMPSNAFRPRPPYSAGTYTLVKPSACALAITSTGWRIATSCSAATGRISFAANSRARTRSSFCSSGSENEQPAIVDCLANQVSVAAPAVPRQAGAAHALWQEVHRVRDLERLIREP